MPRQRKSRRNCRNLATLIHRARHHPYHLRPSTMRRGLQHGLWNANMATYSLANTLSISRSMRQQRRMPPRVRMPSTIGNVSAGHLHLAEVQISEPQRSPRSQRSQRTYRKRRCESMPLRENLSTIVLHRNPHFNALGVTRSVMLRLNSKEGTGKDASSIGNDQTIDSAPKVKVEPEDTPPARKKLKPKKSRAECSSDSSAGTTRHAGATQSASTSAGSSSNSKSSSAESNSFDGNNDEEAVIVAPLAMVPATKVAQTGLQVELSKRMALKRKSPRTQELVAPAMPSVARAGTLGCPTLSAILLSVDNFLKRRRVSSNLR